MFEVDQKLPSMEMFEVLAKFWNVLGVSIDLKYLRCANSFELFVMLAKLRMFQVLAKLWNVRGDSRFWKLWNVWGVSMGLKWLKLSRSGRTKCFKAMLPSHILVKVKCLRCLKSFLRWKCLKCSKSLNAEVVARLYLKVFMFL
jgi:hypothetical protein